MEKCLNVDTLKILIGSTKAFITNKNDVDTGKVVAATIDAFSFIEKVVIQGEKKATVTPDKLFETTEEALKAAIEITANQIRDLNDSKAALEGRYNNLQKEALDRI
jgi:ketopantoate hydroxymethyltransferase